MRANQYTVWIITIMNKVELIKEEFRRLCSFARHGKLADIEEIIDQSEHNIPIDYKDDMGNTLLHIAAQNGHKRLVKFCLRRGASLKAQTLSGQTPLHFAFGFGHQMLGEYLITKGANDSISNSDGLTCYEGLNIGNVSSL